MRPSSRSRPRHHDRVGDGERSRVAGERARRVAIDVARELVEQQDERERALRGPGPAGEGAAQRRLHRVAESRADRVVEGGILAKPLARADVREPSPNQKSRMSGGERVHRADIVRPGRPRKHCLSPRRPAQRFPMQQTSHRDIFLLACCQALLLVNNAGLISMNALIGYALTDNKTYASLGATTYVLGSALATMPASLWMGRVGRRRGFMTGSAIGDRSAPRSRRSAVWLGSFPLFCLATAIIGVYTAFGLQYRFAAAEVAAPVVQGEGDLAGAGGRRRRRLPRPRVDALGEGPVRDAVPRLLRGARRGRRRRVPRAVAGARAAAVARGALGGRPAAGP